MKRYIPQEITTGGLIGFTVCFQMPPFNLPAWVIFVTWGGAILLGETTLEGSIKSTYPALMLGVGVCIPILLTFSWIAAHVNNVLSATALNAGLLCGVAIIVLFLERIPLFANGAWIFLGFACCEGVVDSQAGPPPHTMWMYALVTLLTTFLGPILAWVSTKVLLPLPRFDFHPQRTATGAVDLPLPLVPQQTMYLTLHPERRTVRLTSTSGERTDEQVLLTLMLTSAGQVAVSFPAASEQHSSKNGESTEENARSTERVVVSKALPPIVAEVFDLSEREQVRDTFQLSDDASNNAVLRRQLSELERC